MFPAILMRLKLSSVISRTLFPPEALVSKPTVSEESIPKIIFLGNRKLKIFQQYPLNP